MHPSGRRDSRGLVVAPSSSWPRRLVFQRSSDPLAWSLPRFCAVYSFCVVVVVVGLSFCHVPESSVFSMLLYGFFMHLVFVSLLLLYCSVALESFPSLTLRYLSFDIFLLSVCLSIYSSSSPLPLLHLEILKHLISLLNITLPPPPRGSPSSGTARTFLVNLISFSLSLSTFVPASPPSLSPYISSVFPPAPRPALTCSYAL